MGGWMDEQMMVGRQIDRQICLEQQVQRAYACCAQGTVKRKYDPRSVFKKNYRRCGQKTIEEWGKSIFNGRK